MSNSRNVSTHGTTMTTSHSRFPGIAGRNTCQELPNPAVRPAVMEVMESRVLMSYTPAAELPVSETAGNTGNQSRALAVDSDGDSVIAWISNDGSGTGVNARRFSPAAVTAGNPSGAVGGEFRANTFTAGDQREAQVAMAPGGNFAVIWTSNGQDGSSLGVYGQRYDAQGLPQGSEFRVNVNTTGEQALPSAAIDDTGNLVVVWQSSHENTSKSGRGRDVYARFFSATGVAGGEILVNTTTSNDQFVPAVAMGAGGDFVVTWSGVVPIKGQSSGDLNIYAQRFNAAGVKVEREFLVNSTTATSQNLSEVATDSTGFTICWVNDYTNVGNADVYAQRYDLAGGKRGGEFRVNTSPTGYSTSPYNPYPYPTIDMDGSGGFAVSWRGYADGPSDADLDCYARVYGADGLPAGEQFQVNTVHQSFGGTVVFAPGGDLLCGYGGQAEGGGWGVYARMFLRETTTTEATTSTFSDTQVKATETDDGSQTETDPITTQILS